MTKEKVEKAFETLRTGVLDLINNPDEMEMFFKSYGEHYQYNTYSANNTVLLMFQTSAMKGGMFQMARGYKQWQKEFNRNVKNIDEEFEKRSYKLLMEALNQIDLFMAECIA